MRILQCIKASGNRSVARAAIIGLLISVAVALIVVNRVNSRAAVQSDSVSTQADAASTFTVYAPYWSTEPGFVSTIEMMNYRVDEPLTVSPVVYPLGGGKIALDPITLNPSETRLLNINEALAARGETVTIGSAEIRYSHVTEAVFGANLTAVNVGKSLIYSAPLRGPQDTKQLEGIWWFWDQGTDGFVAVQNAGAEDITVTPTLYVQEHAYLLDSLELTPHEMKIINLREKLRGRGLEAATEGGIHLVSSVAGAVVAAGSLDNPAIGFSAPIRMGNPQLEAERSKPLATARKLHALNLSIGTPPPEMGLPSTTVFKPVVVLRNVARSVVQVHPVFRYQVGSSQRSFALPTVRLNSQQIAQLDLLRYWQSGQIPHEVSTGSLELRYTGKPGSLFASATSVDQTGTFVLDARIDNHLAAGFAGEFWCIEGDNNTFVSVKNISDSSATCSISLRYDAGRGVYEMQPMTLESGEMRVINLKRLQSERIPGANGEILPESAVFGGMKFVEEPGGRRFLVEGGVFNPRTGTCGVCGFGCLYPLSLITIPGGIDVVVGVLSGALGVQANMCDGTHQTGWQCSCDFTSDDGSIATVNQFCTHFATGVNSGNTFLSGTAVDIPGPRCGEQTLIAFCQVRVKPHINSLAPAVGTPGSVVSVMVNGSGFGPSSFMVASGNGITILITDNLSSAQVVASFQIDFGTAAGNYDVTLTSNNQTSNAVTFTIRIPDHLVVISDTAQSQAVGGCQLGTPIARLITFQVVDAQGNQVGVVPVKENFVSISSNSCGNGTPQPTGCLNTDGISSNFTDTITVNCNPVNGSCGYTITHQWRWCPTGGSIMTLATLVDTVHSDQVTVNNNTAGFAAGAIFRP